METYIVAALLVFGYLLGSVPFALLLVRWKLGIDLRTVGSGNIGANNVLRTGRKDLAALTLILDAAKGALPVLLAAALISDRKDISALVGFSAFLGHLYPVWLKFRGGKGVATSAGILLAHAPPLLAVAAVVWGLAAAAARISSLAALAAAFCVAVITYILAEPTETRALATAMAILVFWRHRANIIRLVQRSEPHIGEK